MNKGEKTRQIIFDSTIDWDHHICYCTYNILYQIWCSQPIVKSNINLTRFFPCGIHNFKKWHVKLEPAIAYGFRNKKVKVNTGLIKIWFIRIVCQIWDGVLLEMIVICLASNQCLVAIRTAVYLKLYEWDDCMMLDSGRRLLSQVEGIECHLSGQSTATSVILPLPCGHE